MSKKSPVTVSELSCQDDLDGGKCYSRYIYAECSLCEELSDLMRICVYYEKDKDGKLGFSSANFQFTDKFYTYFGWYRVPRTRFGRIGQSIVLFLRRLRLACKVVVGGKVYLSAPTDLNLSTIKSLALKVIEVVNEAGGKKSC